MRCRGLDEVSYCISEFRGTDGADTGHTFVETQSVSCLAFGAKRKPWTIFHANRQRRLPIITYDTVLLVLTVHLCGMKGFTAAKSKNRTMIVALSDNCKFLINKTELQHQQRRHCKINLMSDHCNFVLNCDAAASNISTNATMDSPIRNPGLQEMSCRSGLQLRYYLGVISKLKSRG